MRANLVKILPSVINKICFVTVNVSSAPKRHIWTQYSHIKWELRNGTSTLTVRISQIDTPCSHVCDAVPVGDGRCFMHRDSFIYAEVCVKYIFRDQLTTQCSRKGKQSQPHDRLFHSWGRSGMERGVPGFRLGKARVHTHP